MEIGSVDKNGSTNDDTLEDDEYEPIISTPSVRSKGEKLGVRVSVNQHKIEALKWISSVLATAVLLCSAKDMFGVRMNREETVAVQDLEGGVVSSIKQQQIAIKQQQIANYIKGTAIIRNIHITHHAGTSLCGQMSKVPNEHTPGFACMKKGRNNDTYWPEEAIKASPFDGKHQVGKEVSYNETKEWVSFWRQYYHFVSGEYPDWDKTLHQTNWEYENLVSMIVMRNPLERFLAGGKCGGFQKKIPDDPSNETQDTYWEYANSECADNYALRVLTREPCVQGANTSSECLQGAKDLLNRITFILDQSCLNESVEAFGSALHLNFTKDGFESRLHHWHANLSVRDRFGNDTLYEYVQTRFRRDIELYEWSKNRSIVLCNN